MLVRSESRGNKVNWAAWVRKFSFTVSPVTTVGTDVAIPLRIGEVTNDLAHARDSSFELSGIVLFPTIADPRIFCRDDFITHKRSSNGYFIGRNIDYQLWKRASRE